MNIIESALKYLEQNRLLNIHIIEAIKRNSSEILYASDKGVLINEKRSDFFMLSTNDIDLARELIKDLPKKDMFSVNQKEIAPIVREKFGYDIFIECYNSVYVNNIPPKVDENIDIRQLDEKDKKIVHINYNHSDEDYEYTSFLIDEKLMWGAFDGDTLMGFVGMHSEGSCGLLDVLPEYRNKGVAQALQSFIISYVMSKGWTAFGQVVKDNVKSLNLQKKLGLELSKDTVFWLG